MAKKYFGLEKRKYFRLEAHYIVSYRSKEMHGDYDLTQTKDISQGGAILTTDRAFKKNAYMELVVKFPFLTKRITVAAKVTTCKKIIEGSMYEVRVKFMDLAPEYVKKLGEYISSRRGKE